MLLQRRFIVGYERRLLFSNGTPENRDVARKVKNIKNSGVRTLSRSLLHF